MPLPLGGAAVPERPFGLLRSVSLFAPVPLGTVENVARRVTEMKVQPGDEIVREGEPGERLYVIAEGEFDVSCTRGAFPSLGAGDHSLNARLLHRHGQRAHGGAAVRARPQRVPHSRGQHYATRTAASIADERAVRVPVA